MAANYLNREFISHSRKVCSLYKRMLRDQDYWTQGDLLEGRFRKLEIRREFEKNMNIKDVRKGKAILEKAEQDFRLQIHPFHHDSPPFHPFSKEGISYGRILESPDYVMDFYNPYEKAQYPYYYAKREAMKEKYIELWRKKMM